jgi:glycogen debranching enzyme
MPDFDPLSFLVMNTSNPAVNRAYRVAMGDLIGNIRPFRDGLLEEPQPVVLAGLDYDTPWTRDAAINTWNGLGLIWPATARNTLLSVLEQGKDGLRIGGQYWDSIIWALGAWAYYLYSGDREFLGKALEATSNSLEQREVEEFDAHFGLFRGPAVYGDGVAAYPDCYSPGGTSSILDWVKYNPEKKASGGYGIPMMALSTNAVYAQAYRTAAMMARELGIEPNPAWEDCAAALIDRIQAHFWNPEKGTFNYLVDPDCSCDFQEGLGHCFTLLFDLVGPEQAGLILKNQHITPAGIPCVWPTFARYERPDGQSFGRHSGTVWPHVSGFWADAALRHGRADLFENEFELLTKHINRDGQCSEIYHPLSGEIYGGLQEAGAGPDGMQWRACARQSWTASAYLRMLLTGPFGLRFSQEGIHFKPFLPKGLERVHISGLPYRACRLDIMVEGQGGQVAEFRWKGTQTRPYLPAGLRGDQRIEIRMVP